MRLLLPIVFGVTYASGCPTGKSIDTADCDNECDIIEAPCPEPGERFEMDVCDAGNWGVVVQCVGDTCVYADYEIVSPDDTLWASCDEGFTTLNAYLCGC